MDEPAAPPRELGLYLPHPESDLARDLIKGSAIVGVDQSGGRVLVHFEGNSLGAAQLARYRDRAGRAADHLLFNYPSGYPTKAQRIVDPREIERIGALDVATRQLTVFRGADELVWWLDEADLIDLGLIATAR